MAFSASHCLPSLSPCAPTSISSSVNSQKNKKDHRDTCPSLDPAVIAKTSQISWADVFIHIFHSVDSEPERGDRRREIAIKDKKTAITISETRY